MLFPSSSSDFPDSASSVDGTTDAHHITWLIFTFLVEMGFCQVGFELLTSGDLPALDSQSAGITDVSHHTQPTMVFVVCLLAFLGLGYRYDLAELRNSLLSYCNLFFKWMANVIRWGFFWNFFVETGSCYVAQTVTKLLASSNSPASASQMLELQTLAITPSPGNIIT